MDLTTLTQKVKNNISSVIVGKAESIDLLLVALICEGHVLIEDVPGVGKTMLARALAISLGGLFKRLQCTPDLLPNDITGVSIYSQADQDFHFRRGPVFVNILLADEINRATPRTQSALLEAMGERQVTVDGTTYPLPKPFMVIATQNPVEYEGTFPLPEAQLDRFLLKVDLGYPTHEEEQHILQRLERQHPIEILEPVIQPEDILKWTTQVWDINVDQTIRDYMINLVNTTRNHPDIILGGSPRGTLSLFKACQAFAAIHNRDHVLPDDVKYLAVPVLSHRLLLKPEAELRGITSVNIIERIIETTALNLKDQDEK
jgi:MoxR-like ATPase